MRNISPSFAAFVTVLVVIFCGLFSLNLLMADPPVWPDEALYADSALNIIKHGQAGTSLAGNLYPYAKEYNFSYPPLFLNSVAEVFRLTNFSIYSQRLFSLLLSLGVLVGLYLFARELISSEGRWILPLLLIFVSFDYTFSRAAHISRPEIMVLFFSIPSLLFFEKEFSSGGKRTGTGASSVLAGFFAALAVLTHFIGAFLPIAEGIFLLLIYRLKIFRVQKIYVYCATFALTLLPWVFSIISHWNIFLLQVSASFARKVSDETWLLTAFSTQPTTIKLLYVFYLLTTVIFVIKTFNDKSPAKTLLSVTLDASWLVSIVGKQFWYYVFPVPFIYLAAALIVNDLINGWGKMDQSLRKMWLLIMTPLILIAAGVSLFLQFTLLSTSGDVYYRYNEYSQAILAGIPAGWSVFMSAIPDPYFALKTRNSNALYEFPSLSVPRDKYLRLLDKTDYVVYNGSYEEMVFGNLLNSYLQKNYDTIVKIGQPGGYQALVIKLKPRNLRVNSVSE